MEDGKARLHDALLRWEGRAGLDASDSPDGPRAARELLDAAAELVEPRRDRSVSPSVSPVVGPGLLHHFLEATGRPRFLLALEDDDRRCRWTETAFAAIRASDYRLDTMLTHRARELRDKPLFELYGESRHEVWSYQHVLHRARSFAAAFLAEAEASARSESASDEGLVPRVALYVGNSVDGACCDLACLLHDILVTPLSVHFEVDDLVWVFDRLRINIAVADNEDRLRRLRQVRARTCHPFSVLSLQPTKSVDRGDAVLLDEASTRLTPEMIERILARLPRRSLDEVCTVMFTSGSTGRPKGVAFTPFNIVSKRFARAAALPAVGSEEKLFCYLPLCHTFGRYLELLGTIFWRGTYVFAGNPSVETLLAGLQEVRPTGLIGVPLRWTQIRDCVQRGMEALDPREPEEEVFRRVTGGRLRWGLSAAGYLDPKIFRFFHRHGVGLCSGFGMTEATGGITMSPPGDYLDDSVGVPLPGMRLRYSDQGEMLIGGVYVARYLAEEGEDLQLDPMETIDGEEWLQTGDIFRPLEREHVSIVDRVKDIYKNSRGQTVAPRRVEQEFHEVPGIRRTFLVGDHRAYNALLIVPDPTDPVLADAPDAESRTEYFHRIVAAANERLASYERVVSYAVLDRDFDTERGELTPKGSYRRKVIESSFADVIESLYRSSHVELQLNEISVQLPQWLHRDLGVLEDDIVSGPGGLVDRRRRLELPIWRSEDGERIGIGDLEYRITGTSVDLGLVSRQPQLWLGNPALTRFFPCKDGWDVGLGPFSGRVNLPAHRSSDSARGPSELATGLDEQIIRVHLRIQDVLFGPVEPARSALEELSRELADADDRLSVTIRQRITALATHPDEELRCLAYRVLLLDEPTTRYDEAFGAFIRSGLSFLNRESIRHIATSRFERRRLQSLKRRLYRYRQEFPWPADDVARQQFEGILRILTDFAREHPEYYRPVRTELASWIVHHEDPELSQRAQRLLDELVEHFEGRLESSLGQRARLSEGRIVFDADVPLDRREQLHRLLTSTSFLAQSLLLAFNESGFDAAAVPKDGIWVSAVQSTSEFHVYRLSVRTEACRHYHLLIIVREDLDIARVQETNYWMLAIGGYPYGERVLPRFGCVRPELGAMSLEYVNELNVEEKIRQYASAHHSGREAQASDWRKLFVGGMATVFRVWRNSGRRILPGSLCPSNVVVPELDFREGAVVLSMAGWRPYENVVDLFRRLHDGFYRRTVAHHPACDDVLEVRWIFDACVEALGKDAGPLLRELDTELRGAPSADLGPRFLAELTRSLESFDPRAHVPLPLQSAIDRYHRWLKVDPKTTAAARSDQVESLMSLYRLDRFGELARYRLYRHTYFSQSSPPVTAAFDRLLDSMQAKSDRPATRRVELSDLRATLDDPDDRLCFSRLVFPHLDRPQDMDVLTFGETGREQITVRTSLVDRIESRYDVREPVEAEEVGQVYRLFFRERFPKRVHPRDRYLIATDATERIVAAIVYRFQEPAVVHMDGVVVHSSLRGRGIATGLLEDFVTRMASSGVEVVKTSFIMRSFCEKRGFHVDRRWGGLVRVLSHGEVEEQVADPPLEAMS